MAAAAAAWRLRALEKDLERAQLKRFGNAAGPGAPGKTEDFSLAG